MSSICFGYPQDVQFSHENASPDEASTPSDTAYTPPGRRFASTPPGTGFGSRDPVTDNKLDELNKGHLQRRLSSLGFSGPISLYTLPDYPLNVKPRIEYAVLVMVALYVAPTKKLQLQEIFKAIIERYPFFEHEPSWRDSIRHMLSLKRQFCHLERLVGAAGQGGYWYLDLSQGEGDGRERKRSPLAKAASLNSQCDETCSNHSWV
ncbi:hypothetical protein HDZ31DRAFT_68125 [Schizophyllum fasciatum]